MLRFCVHYGIHFIVPILMGWFFFKKEDRLKAILILLGGIIIDIDHLLASPIFDPQRCSIDFHPLHSYAAIAFYLGLLLFKKTRIFGWAFLIHIVADSADCWLLSLQVE